MILGSFEESIKKDIKFVWRIQIIGWIQIERNNKQH